MPPGFRRQLPIIFELSDHFFVFLVVLFLALLLKIRDRWIRAEEEKLSAELAYLKTQINPHFLFNTLNSIYAMALGKSEQTAAAIVRLSSMMRYVLTDAGREKVSLKQEIAYLIDYIELQKTRFEGTLRVDLSVHGDPADKRLVPLLLIPFVENAFKHGVGAVDRPQIEMRLAVREGRMRFEVRNSFDESFSAGQEEHTGLGLNNVRTRLELLYPKNHHLDIRKEDNWFHIVLTLKLI